MDCVNLQVGENIWQLFIFKDLFHQIIGDFFYFFIKISKQGDIFKELLSRGENGMDIFRPYSRPNPFSEVQIYPYLSPDIQHPIPYPYPNNQIAYL